MPKCEDLHYVLQKHMPKNQIATNRKNEISTTANNHDNADGVLSKEELKATTIENDDNSPNNDVNVNDDN